MWVSARPREQQLNAVGEEERGGRGRKGEEGGRKVTL